MAAQTKLLCRSGRQEQPIFVCGSGKSFPFCYMFFWLHADCCFTSCAHVFLFQSFKMPFHCCFKDAVPLLFEYVVCCGSFKWLSSSHLSRRVIVYESDCNKRPSYNYIDFDKSIWIWICLFFPLICPGRTLRLFTIRQDWHLEKWARSQMNHRGFNRMMRFAWMIRPMF